MQEKNYVGIDLGKRMMEICSIYPDNSIKRGSLKTDISGRQKLYDFLTENDVVGMEACSYAFFLAKEIMKKTSATVIVMNAGDLAVIYRSLKKTDKEDALKIARIMQRHPREELPEVRIPDENEERMRGLSREQNYWSTTKNRAINRLHSIFVYDGITTLMKKDLKSKKRRELWITKLSDRLCAEAKRLNQEILLAEGTLYELDNEIRLVLKDNKEKAKIVLSVPGIGPKTALAILGYMGEPSRFSHVKQVTNYVGLVPKVDISGSSVHYGRTIKRGCRMIKRNIVQAAWVLTKSKYGMDLRTKYMQLSKIKGKKKSIVAVARKMIELVYTLLKKNELYRYMPEERIELKLSMYGLD
ncbi:MAG: IS110 family transposase [Spirochaetes bacterium]|nr:IS110 family transposase [Spirochaetota bacterium]